MRHRLDAPALNALAELETFDADAVVQCLEQAGLTVRDPTAYVCKAVERVRRGGMPGIGPLEVLQLRRAGPPRARLPERRTRRARRAAGLARFVAAAAERAGQLDLWCLHGDSYAPGAVSVSGAAGPRASKPATGSVGFKSRGRSGRSRSSRTRADAAVTVP